MVLEVARRHAPSLRASKLVALIARPSVTVCVIARCHDATNTHAGFAGMFCFQIVYEKCSADYHAVQESMRPKSALKVVPILKLSATGAAKVL